MERTQVTVQIMLGGKSERMGRDKALVELGGKTLLDLALERWQGFGGALQLSVGPAARAALAPAGTAAVADIYPERGPLGGLHAGLKSCPTDALLLTAVDAPWLTPAHADLLLAAMGEAEACVFVRDGFPEPLFGLYRRHCVTAAETLLLRGDNRMRSLLEWVNTAYVPIADAAAFRNLNTPEDLALAQVELRRTLSNSTT